MTAPTGTDTVFLVPGSEAADRQDQHARTLEATVAAGVRLPQESSMSGQTSSGGSRVTRPPISPTSWGLQWLI